MGKLMRKCLGRTWLAVVVALVACGGVPDGDSPDAQTPHPDGGTGLVIGPAELLPAKVGRTYEQSLTVSGGRGPYVWSLTTDPELDWLSIDAQGVLRDSASPSSIADQPLSLRVAVIDADGLSGSRDYSLQVTCDEGAVVSCVHAQAEACVTGQRRCVSGQLTACESVGELEYSANVRTCGESCSPCDPAQASTCRDGKCACGSSPACSAEKGTTCCGRETSAGCVRLAESVEHCGSCGRNCGGSAVLGARKNVVPGCTSAQCSFPCQQGYLSCDGAGDQTSGSDATGCETEVLSNLENCGGCGVSCTQQAVGRQNLAIACGAGQCSFQCRPNFANCSAGAVNAAVGNDADGCETSLTSLQNCGACGTVCSAPANGTAICTATGCDVVCNTGFMKCGNSCVGSDVLNCGTCGTVCRQAPANASPSCNAGQCGYSCDSTHKDCGGYCIKRGLNCN